MHFSYYLILLYELQLFVICLALLPNSIPFRSFSTGYVLLPLLHTSASLHWFSLCKVIVWILASVLFSVLLINSSVHRLSSPFAVSTLLFLSPFRYLPIFVSQNTPSHNHNRFFLQWHSYIIFNSRCSSSSVFYSFMVEFFFFRVRDLILLITWLDFILASYFACTVNKTTDLTLVAGLLAQRRRVGWNLTSGITLIITVQKHTQYGSSQSSDTRERTLLIFPFL